VQSLGSQTSSKGQKAKRPKCHSVQSLTARQDIELEITRKLRTEWTQSSLASSLAAEIQICNRK
jgi:hypothetical protein